MKICGVLVLFDGAECSVSPIGDPVELTERLAQFCRAVLADDDILNCVAGMHGHTAGDCARK